MFETLSIVEFNHVPETPKPKEVEETQDKEKIDKPDQDQVHNQSQKSCSIRFLLRETYQLVEL